MTSQLALVPLSPEEGADYGLARVRDLAFDAVIGLWKRRRGEGMTQKDIASKTGTSPATISRNLRAPGNWTLRTFGELVYALDGDVTIVVQPAEDVVDPSNYDAYEATDDKPVQRVEIPFSTVRGLEIREQPGGVAPLRITMEKIA